ncbi:tripeptide transporter permease [Erwinia tracheiphila PSU-1]|nr:tripeptide transporter permease [Erwinia tracheiphila PSU-1]
MYSDVFLKIGIVTAAIALIMLLTAPKLNRMAQDDHSMAKGNA